MDERRRTFNTPTRSCWNVSIHNLLKAVDNHTRLYLATGEQWHEDKAMMLRSYLHELKTYIHAQEELAQKLHTIKE